MRADKTRDSAAAKEPAENGPSFAKCHLTLTYAYRLSIVGNSARRPFRIPKQVKVPKTPAFCVSERRSHPHLFYNVGKASPSQNWLEPGNVDAFGHATSTDLKTWTSHNRVMHVVPDSWEGQTVSAPSILKVDNTYKMIYTGFSDKIHGNQTIGLALVTPHDTFREGGQVTLLLEGKPLEGRYVIPPFYDPKGERMKI